MRFAGRGWECRSGSGLGVQEWEWPGSAGGARRVEFDGGLEWELPGSAGGARSAGFAGHLFTSTLVSKIK